MRLMSRNIGARDLRCQTVTGAVFFDFRLRAQDMENPPGL